MIKKSRLRWFGHVERKYDNDWVKRCITWEVEGIRQRGHPKKTWWDCVKDDMESLGLSQKDAQSRNKWRRRIKGGNRLTQVHLEKWPLITECVFQAWKLKFYTQKLPWICTKRDGICKLNIVTLGLNRHGITHVGKQDALRLKADGLSVTTVVEEVFQTEELESTHLPLVLPHYHDRQLTRLQRQRTARVELRHSMNGADIAMTLLWCIYVRTHMRVLIFFIVAM